MCLKSAHLAESRRRIAVLAAAIALAVPGVGDAKQRFKTVKSSGTIEGHLAQPATAEGYAFAGFASDSKLGEGARTSQGSFEGAKGSGQTTARQDVEGYATFEYTQMLKLPKR